jgi:hypothetical protein
MALLLLLLIQDPVIERVRTLTGGVVRSGCWLPVEVTVRGPFDGEVVVRTDMGVRFVKAAAVAAGASERILVPAIVLQLDARVEAVLRGGGRELARVRVEPLVFASQRDLLVGDGSGRTAVTPLGDRTAYVFPFVATEWSDGALLESIDVIAGDPKGAPLALFLAQGGRVGAAPALAEIVPPENARFEAIEELSGPLLGSDRWIASKRQSATLLLVLYFASLLVAAAWLGLKKASAVTLLGVVAVLSGTFCVAQRLVPRGDVSVTAWTAQVGEAEISLAWIRSERTARVDVSFTGLAKPVFDSYGDATRADFELVFAGERTNVRAAKLPQAFVAAGERRTPEAVRLEVGPWVSATNACDVPIRAHALMDRRNGPVGTIEPGKGVVIGVTEDAPAPPGEEFALWRKRLLWRDCVFGWRVEPDGEFAAVTGMVLVERRRKARFFVAPVEGRKSG